MRNCELSDNIYGVWGKPEYFSGNPRLITGIYKLEEVVGLGTHSGWGSPECHYRIHEKQPMPIIVSINTQFENNPANTYYRNIFTAYQSELSGWSGEGREKKCLSDNPIVCPIVETPEISMLFQYEMQSIMFYFPQDNAGGFEPNFGRTHTLSYEKLHEICGATSNCIIDIGSCDQQDDHCSSWGTVSLDISTPNIVKIDQINTSPLGISQCTFKKKEPFNTIYCDFKK
ncbi:hypothetical protein [Legionella santicrucis]|uniref:hypothetical protein n=1 Tax=Legionella santicrucis TaxID=45074 RepID=UPI00105682AE|nr:hypothetical protein [Legionella santicrucis]